MNFSVLASGSAGNASLLEADGFGVLIDAGLGPRQLATRLTAVGASWQRVRAVVLTHTHSDHWNDRTFAHLRRQRIPLYCHAGHHAPLASYAPAFAGLRADGLVRSYAAGEDLTLAPGIRCRPLPLRHDGSVTCGFRFDVGHGLFGGPTALAYAADLGCWQPDLARALADVDILALEFNHDVGMEYASGRSPRLIMRVLGDEGHLSNVQAAGLLREMVRLSEPGRLRHLVQLHLSRDCNRPALAVAAAGEVLAACTPPVAIHTARQDEPGPCLALGEANGVRRPRPRVRRPRPARPAESPAFFQPWLPGWETSDCTET
ncbi:MAG TPA: MBL fold metallo-hydrolase [Gemmataceae bacterium]|nr:MBL fold metallo-hydrolase [Gemmataceae bacterium]